MKKNDPTDYKQREAICKGCRYWRRAVSHGGKTCYCHFAFDGMGTAVLDNGKGAKLDMANKHCPNKAKRR